MTIQTNRLELLIETEEDLDAVYDLRPQIHPPEHPPIRGNLEEEQQFYILIRKGMFKGYFGRWLVNQRSDNALIGLGYILPHLCTPEESASLPNGSPYRTFEVEVGWALAPSYRRQGYGTELGAVLCRYALDEIKLERIIGVTDTNNPASIRVMERIGMEVINIPNSSGVLGWVNQKMLNPIS